MYLSIYFKVAAFLATAMSIPVFANSQYVNGYLKKDGTYVAGYVRTSSDSSVFNNYSSSPNVNPLTGKTGTIEPLDESVNMRLKALGIDLEN